MEMKIAGPNGISYNVLCGAVNGSLRAIHYLYAVHLWVLIMV